MKSLFEGVCVALVTPFKNGNVDFESLKRMFERQLEAKVSAISVLGTTGEPCTLSEQEKKQIIRFCEKIDRGKTKLIVGTGGANTLEACKMSKFALEHGADGALVVTPYYNKCTQNGLIEYYEKITSYAQIPTIVYNVPSRTGVNVLPTTMEKLAQIPQVVGIKQASMNMDENLQILSSLSKKIAIYSGEDRLNFVFYALGASGCVSVTANAFPKRVRSIFERVKAGEFLQAREEQYELENLNKLLFCEVNPIPIKACLAMMGLCENELRSPLTRMEDPSALEREIKKIKNDSF